MQPTRLEHKGFYGSKKSIPRHEQTASGLPVINLLDFTPLQSKDIAPYQCASCQSIFKRLSGLVIHNSYYRHNGKCPSEQKLIDLNLQQVTYIANGNEYKAWHPKPQLKETGNKDELLVQLEAIAFPNFN
jgi:hypothetical protein